MGVFLLGFVFSVWLVASAMNQFEWKFWRHVTNWDFFALLPRWTFFAPRPGTDDVRLVYRDVLPGGSHGGWVEIETSPGSNPLIRMFWNPVKLDNKALFDLVHLLAEQVDACQEFPRVALISMPYVQLLDPVMQLPRGPEATHRQFALLRTRGHVPPRETAILLLSQPHAFDPA
jgi:hypothetical protein